METGQQVLGWSTSWRSGWWRGSLAYGCPHDWTGNRPVRAGDDQAGPAIFNRSAALGWGHHQSRRQRRLTTTIGGLGSTWRGSDGRPGTDNLKNLFKNPLANYPKGPVCISPLSQDGSTWRRQDDAALHARMACISGRWGFRPVDGQRVGAPAPTGQGVTECRSRNNMQD